MMPDDRIGFLCGCELTDVVYPDLIEAGANQTTYRLLIVDNSDL
jgi:hypothetical protein